MDKYKFEKIDEKDFTNSVEITIRFRHRKKGKELDVPDMYFLHDMIEENLPEDANTMVRALNGHRYFTFKGYNSYNIRVQDFENYYKGTVEEMDKFEKFEFIDISVFMDKP